MASVPELEAYRFDKRNWESWEQLQEEFEWEIPDEFNIASYVCDRWAEDRGKVAIYATDEDGSQTTYTFWELRDAANQFANYLREQGIERGDRIGVSGSQRPETIISHLAAWKLGAVSVPISVLLGPDGLQYRLQDGGVKAFVAYDDNVDALRKVREDLDGLETVLTVDTEASEDEQSMWTTIDDYSKEFDTVATRHDENAIIFYTSGTTGDPKGVVHGHDTLLGVLPSVLTLHNLTIDETEVYRSIVELSWVGSLMDLTLPSLYYGIPVVQHVRQEFDPEAELALIEEYEVSVVWIPPTALRLMMQLDDPGERYDLSSVRVIGSGGESLGDSIVDWADDVFKNADVHEGYGQTEAPALIGDCTVLDVPHRVGKMGKAGPGYEVAVLDPETGEPTIKTGEVGELGLRADNPVTFKKYWNLPEKTEEKLEDEWMLGEDLISIDEEDYITFHSRKDDVIISSGYRMGPTEIEDTIASHEAVVNAGVIGVPHETRGEIPKAFVILADGYEGSDGMEKEIQDYVKQRLAKYEYPRRIEFVDHLPKTTTGKIRRRDLRKREGIVSD
jgi:acetyl-CoA synthetase